MSKVKSARFGEYIVSQNAEGEIKVVRNNQNYDNVKSGLREISAKIGFKYDPEWNTRKFGRELIDELNKGGDTIAAQAELERIKAETAKAQAEAAKALAAVEAQKAAAAKAQTAADVAVDAEDEVEEFSTEDDLEDCENVDYQGIEYSCCDDWASADLFVDDSLESSSKITIPEKVIDSSNGKHYTVTSFCISGGNFTSISLPKTITSIGGEAFSELPAENLKKLQLYISSPHVKIEDGVIYTIDNDKSVTLSNVQMKQPAGKFIIPDGVDTIEAYAFYCCDKLEEVDIPQSVTTINYAPFEGCSQLRTINIYNEKQNIKVYNDFGEKVELEKMLPKGSSVNYITVTNVKADAEKQAAEAAAQQFGAKLTQQLEGKQSRLGTDHELEKRVEATPAELAGARIRVYGKAQSRICLGIMHAYVTMYPQVKLEELRKAFPNSLNPSLKEMFTEIKTAKTFAAGLAFVEDDEVIKLADGNIVAVARMWTKERFESLAIWAKQYGIVVADYEGTSKGGEKGGFRLEYLNGYVPPKPKKGVPVWVWIVIAILLLGLLGLLFFGPKKTVEKVVTETVVVHDTLYVKQIEEIEKNFNAAEFVAGKADLSDDAKFVLHDLAKVMQKNPQVKLRLEGHTSAEGDPAFNQKLSEDRAAAAVTFLIEHEGVDASRLEAVGYGPSRPKNEADPYAPENRRTEFIVVE